MRARSAFQWFTILKDIRREQRARKFHWRRIKRNAKIERERKETKLSCGRKKNGSTSLVSSAALWQSLEIPRGISCSCCADRVSTWGAATRPCVSLRNCFSPLFRVYIVCNGESIWAAGGGSYIGFCKQSAWWHQQTSLAATPAVVLPITTWRALSTGSALDWSAHDDE